MSIQLTVMSLEYGSSVVPTKEVFEKDEITLGRLPENDVVLDKQDVSGVHARVRINRDGPEPKLCITDLGSSNGTMVENNPISSDQEISLENDERIIIGTFLIKLSLLEDQTGSLVSATNGSNGNGSHVTPSVEIPSGFDAADDPFSATSEQTLTEAVTEEKAEDAPTEGGEESGSDTFAMPFGSATQADGDTESSSESSQEASEAEAGDVVAAETEPASESPSQESSTDSDNAEKEEEKSVEASGEFLEEVTVVLSGDDVLELDFEAAALYGITAKVLHKGEPLAGVEISDPVFGTKTSGSDGTIEFPDIEEDSSYALSAAKEKFIFETESSEGTINDAPAEVVFTARELFTIKGNVRHKGQPLADVEVDGGPLGTTRTDADGVYRFENVPEGAEYSIKVKKPNFTIRKK